MSQTEVQLIKSSSVVDGDIVDMSASKLTGTLPAVSGANLTNLPAANLTGTLPAISGANLTGISAGITMADQWRITSNFSGSTEPVTANWERNDTDFDKIGTGMTESSGVFTFPSTGIYYLRHQACFYWTSSTEFLSSRMDVTTNGGTNYNTRSYAYAYLNNVTGTTYTSCAADLMVDVSNTSNVKIRLKIPMTGSAGCMGDSGAHFTGITFLRLGDT